jgi:type II secretory pathway predicted ATPase ExeA
MYEQHFGFRERPFSLLPDSSFLFFGRHHRNALTMLEYALEHETGFALVSGEVGSGKTTLVRYLLTRFASNVSVGVLNHTHRNLKSLTPWVAAAFGVTVAGKGETEVYDGLLQYLLGEYASKRRTILIVDEAQNLQPDLLEELRVLSNLNNEKDLLLQTLLVGQPELRETLKRPELRQFAQRISMDYHLGNLQPAEVAAYVRHRLTVAGGSPDLFSPGALDLVARHSGGVPRLVNMVCDLALIYAFSEQVASIDEALMAAAIRDRASSGIVPLVHSGAGPVPVPVAVAAARA